MSKYAVMPLNDYQNVCEKIRDLTGNQDLIKSGDLPDKITDTVGQAHSKGYFIGYDEGYLVGKQEGGGWLSYDEFWDSLQQNGERRNYWGAFAGWRDELFPPKHPIITDNNHNYMFRNSTIIDTPKVTILGTTIQQLYYGATKLVTAHLSIPDGANSFNATFQNCTKLENLTVEGEIGGNGFDVSMSPLLTKDSILSIINALKDFYPVIIENHSLSNASIEYLSTDLLVEGTTYITTFNYKTAFDEEVYETMFNNAEAVASVIDVYGYGQKVGIHYVADDIFYPDEYEYHLVVFNGLEDSEGTTWVNAIEYRQNKITGEITYAGVEGSKITVKIKQGDASHTVTLGEANLDKLTEKEKAIATKKGWNLQ